MRNILRLGALAFLALAIFGNVSQAQQPPSPDCADGTCNSRPGLPLLQRLFPNRDQPPRQYKSHGCWSHHNAFLCSSWRAEARFIFGSCRTFFGEPCLPQPTHHNDAPIFHVGQHHR